MKILNVMLVITILYLSFAPYALAKEDLVCTNIGDVRKTFIQMWEYRTPSSQNKFLVCASKTWDYFDNVAKIQDAEFTYTISSYLISSLQFNPDNFFVFMDRNRNLLSKWLNNIPNEMFIWYDDSECAFKPQIKQLIKLMSIVEEKTRTLESYKKSNRVLSNIKCTIVN